jgi:single-strand DNA-binding protein
MEPQVTMTGNLVSDPSRRVTAAGVVVTRMRIASNHRRFDRDRGEWISSDPVYLDVNCWRQLGDNVAASLKKGDSVLVTGRLTMREYDDAAGGARRQAFTIEATTVSPDLCRYVTLLARPTRDPQSVTESVTEPAAARPAGEAEAATADGGRADGGRAAQPVEPAATDIATPSAA